MVRKVHSKESFIKRLQLNLKIAGKASVNVVLFVYVIIVIFELKYLVAIAI